jgi:hypothetical protein
MLAFATDAAENAKHRAELQSRLQKLRQDYDTMLYGGQMVLAVR